MPPKNTGSDNNPFNPTVQTIKISWSSWMKRNWEMLVFVEGGKPENPEKNPQSTNNQKTQTT